ncbi:TetR/AcrR family transcriptional regulator [Nocardia donostiensis]|uniref:TetR family transcriptional regulator n=1 Tax=Nocardia donostiensis TaxID=1538463 RepID=A0A1W0B0Z7_9NOCA|nr:TetR/AcrR family transcriptional regulator [Nocardia donostiensis]ONM48464.1 TetR family transcriptional regulator [Nocardia donostiensis]OQS16147.1 TetR family transcriptional regulator [Nocardia donostiensis]OQS18611.1 TetR family transcriptional regulator [Nocardia donostiensis]
MSRVAGQRKRPRQERAKATRNQILDAAARLFGERGIADTSTNKIAAEAGVSIGTLYRYFADRSVIVDDLLNRLIDQVEHGFTERVFEVPRATAEMGADEYTALVAGILEVFTDVLVANAALVKALVGGVQFYSSGLPDLEPRLRLLVKVILIQGLGPGDDATYDTMAFVLINTGFAAVLRVSAVEVSAEERDKALAMTARMMGLWLYSESRRGGE